MTVTQSEAAGSSETSVLCTEVYGPAFQRTVLCGLFRQDVTGVIGNTALVNSGFHTRNSFFENYPLFGQVPSERFASPFLGRCLMGYQIITLLGAPHVSSGGQALKGGVLAVQCNRRHVRTLGPFRQLLT